VATVVNKRSRPSPFIGGHKGKKRAIVWRSHMGAQGTSSGRTRVWVRIEHCARRTCVL
jgi:hypothetical protein